MDILEFINSRDVQRHLRDIDFKPDIFEMAYFVYSSKYRTLDEKIDAFRWIIDHTEDVTIESETYGLRYRYLQEKSVHGLPEEYIDEQQKWRAYFEKPEEGAFYRICYMSSPTLSGTMDEYYELDINKDDIFYSNLSDAIDTALKRISEDDDGSIKWYNIEKHYILRSGKERDRHISCRYGRGNVPVEIYTCGYESGYDENSEYIKDIVPSEIYALLKKEYSIECDFFQRMWFDIPIPFKEGDIVVGNPQNWMMMCEPFVLKDTVPWRRKGKSPGSDDSDMNAAGWSVGFYGRNTDINDDVMAQYLDLEYYRGRFDGLQRLLPLLAFRDQGKIDTWEYNYHRKRIIAEYESEKYRSSESNLTHLNKAEINCLVKGESLCKENI